jgi:hypothetical protein
VVSFTATATDALDGALTPSCTPASGSTFALGATTVTCAATDAHGNTGSARFTVTVVDTTAPTLTVPSNVTAEATSAAGAIVTYTATATDIAGAASMVCAPASGSQFPIAMTPVSCTATDTQRNSVTRSFSVTVADTRAPLVALAAPASVSGVVTLQATVSDSVGVARVTYFANGAPIGAATAAPFSVLWDTSVLVDGSSAMLTASAADAAGNVGTSPAVSVAVTRGPDTQKPAVTIVSPADGSTVAGVVTIAADVTDNVGIKRVVFYVGATAIAVDTAPPYTATVDTREIQVGTHLTLSVRAVDAAGNATIASVEVVVGRAPWITNEPRGEIPAGRPFVFRFRAYASPPPTWVLEGAPPGMTIDSVTGVLSWTPTVAQLGQVRAVVRVSNAVGVDRRGFSIGVVDADAPTAPAGLRATSVRDDKVTLAWNAAIDNVAVVEYRVYEYRARINSWTLAESVQSVTAAIDVEWAGAHVFAVTAVDAAGNESERSASLTAQVPTEK